MIFGNSMNNLQSLSWPLVCLILAILVWIYRSLRLLITRLKTPFLKPAQPKRSPKISVLIPAKNEETNIRACVEAFRKQNYSNFEIIVVNDNSSDRTEAILKEINATYINCPLPPEGWTGKNHALYHGAACASGEWLLFTDADTRHQPHSLSSSMAEAEFRNLEFLSLLPHCLTGTFIEETIQPSAMAYLGLWFPFEKVNDPASPLHFGNGQYILIKRSLYDKLGGHKAVSKEFLEDFALMRLSKQSGARAECAFGTEIYGTRMYESFNTIWRGWRRIYLHAFERRPFPLFKNAASIFLFSFLPFLFPFFFCLPGTLEFALSWVMIVWILSIAWGAHRIVKAKGIYALLQPFAALVIVMILLDAARMAVRKEKTFWR